MRSNSQHKQHPTAEDATSNLAAAADDGCGMPHAIYASQMKLTKSKKKNGGSAEICQLRCGKLISLNRVKTNISF